MVVSKLPTQKQSLYIIHAVDYLDKTFTIVFTWSLGNKGDRGSTSLSFDFELTVHGFWRGKTRLES